MSHPTIANKPLLFADSNVFIEALFIEESPASIVIRLVNLGLFRLATCQTVVSDVENAILNKLEQNQSLLDDIIKRWSVIVEETNLIVLDDPSIAETKQIYKEYIHLMRHENDIPVLAAALKCNPQYILSGNSEHFNPRVSSKCKIQIYDCSEFIESMNAI